VTLKFMAVAVLFSISGKSCRMRTNKPAEIGRFLDGPATAHRTRLFRTALTMACTISAIPALMRRTPDTARTSLWLSYRQMPLTGLRILWRNRRREAMIDPPKLNPW